MNKAELIDVIALKSGMTKKQVNVALDSLMDTVMETVAKGEKVTLVGFGTFEQRHRQGREGRNPSTGEPIVIAATTVPGFSAGKVFKEKVA